MGAVRGKVQAEPISCAACGLQVLGRGGDMEGWKAVQMDPTIPDLSWYCMKPVCQHAYAGALGEAQTIWASRMPQPPQEEPGALQPPLDPSEPGAAERAVERHDELDRYELDQSSDQAVSDQAPRQPPPELLAFETSDPEEAGFKDEVFPYSRFATEEPGVETPEAPPEPPPAQGRYVPKPSAKSQARFIRHDGTGKPDE